MPLLLLPIALYTTLMKWITMQQELLISVVLRLHTKARQEQHRRQHRQDQPSLPMCRQPSPHRVRSTSRGPLLRIARASRATQFIEMAQRWELPSVRPIMTRDSLPIPRIPIRYPPMMHRVINRPNRPRYRQPHQRLLPGGEDEQPGRLAGRSDFPGRRSQGSRGKMSRGGT